MTDTDVALTPDTPLAPEARARHLGFDCLAIVAVSTLLSLILQPFQDMPFVDDWCWAWPVEHLLKTGKIASLEYGGNHAIFTQVFWGAIFCLPGGYSFAALRVSTWVLAMVGLCIFYLTLREQNVSRRDSLIGTALLGFNPMFFVLQYTFMTDVPFLTLTLAAVYAFQRAMRRRSDRWLGVAVLMAILAAGVRTVAVAIPVAMFLALLIHTGRWGRHPVRLIASLAPLGAMAAMLWWREKIALSFADMSGMDTAAETVREKLRLAAVPRMPRSTLETIVQLTVTIGPGLLPLSAAWIGRWHWKTAAAAVLALCALWIAMPDRFTPLDRKAVWGWCELGGLWVPHRPPQVPPQSLLLALIALSIVSTAILATTAFRARPSNVRPLSVWLILGFCGLMAFLWLFYDRYVLPILPLVILLALTSRAITRPRIAIAITAVLAAISIVGLRDNLAFESAKWQAYRELLAQGVPVADIDANYTVNCRMQYGYPEKARRGSDGAVRIPDFNTDEIARFQIAGQHLPGTILQKTVSYSQWMGRTRQFYIIEHPTIRRSGQK